MPDQAPTASDNDKSPTSTVTTIATKNPDNTMVASGDGYEVYLDSHQELTTALNTFPASQTLSDIRNIFSKCRFLINSRFAGERAIRLKLYLGGAFGNALDTLHQKNDDPKAIKYMKEAEKFISDQKTEEESIVYFTFISIIIAIISITACVFLHFNEAKFGLPNATFLAVTFGIVGALTSIIQRTRTIQPEKFSKPSYHWLQASIFLALGAISGILVFLAAKGNLLMGTIVAQPDALLVFCFASGFSERFFDSLVSKLDDKALKS